MFKAVLFFLISLITLPVGATEEAVENNTENPKIFINQIMLGQEAGSKNEFVELYNPNSQAIDLKEYSLKKKTKSGTESNLISNKKFVGIIPAYGYFLISSPEFCASIFCDLAYSTSASLSANNTILLYQADKKISDKIGYGQVQDFWQEPALELQENESLVRQAKKYEEAKYERVEYKEANNKLDFIKQTQEIIIHNSLGQKITIPAKQREVKKENNSSKKSEVGENIFLDLWNISQASNNDNISSAGIVSVLPGALGSQYFYIHLSHPEDNTIYGLQIYNYQKKFPQLKIGDYIKVSGILGLSEICKNSSTTCPKNSNFYRLKIKDSTDIKIISADNILKVPEIEKISTLNWDQIGQLKTISGKITQNKTNAIYLDDSENEILLEIKKGTQISSKILAENFKFTISGILNYKEKELKLTLINSEYITGEQALKIESLGKVLDEDFLENRKRKEN